MFKLQIAGTVAAVQKWTTDNIYKTEATAKRRARQIMKADAGVYSVWIRETGLDTSSCPLFGSKTSEQSGHQDV